MKILAIRGANLASLKGAFEIDLAAPPLCHLGLFAIAGPVGAGKSTLLDAMCLALFNRTPRLSGHGGAPVVKDADALKSNDPRSLVRRGAAGAFAEVDLRAVDGRSYRARWQVRRARGQAFGKLLSAELSLVDLASGTRIGEGTTDTLERIEEKLGLSFDELCRSMLLAQGSFSSFLKARPEERAQLLEKITGTEIYSTLSMRAFGRARVEESGLIALEEQMRALAPATPLQRVALQYAADEATQLHAERARVVEQVEARERHNARANELALLVRNAERDREGRELERNESEAGARVTALAPVWPVRSAWRALDEARAQAVHVQRAFDSARDDDTQARATTTTLTQQREQTSGALALAEKTFADAQPMLERALVLDEQIARSPTKALVAEHELSSRDDAAKKSAVERTKTAHAEAKSVLEAAEAALAAEPDLARVAAVWPTVLALLDQMARAEMQREGAIALASNARLRRDEAQVARERAHTALTDVVRVDDDAHALLLAALGASPSITQPDTLLAAAAALVDERARADVRIEAAARELTARNADEQRAIDVADVCERAHNDADAKLTAVSALAARAALVDGEACPVCGSAEHPAVAGAHGDAQKHIDVAAVALLARERAMEARKAAEALSAAHALVAQSARALDDARANAASLADRAREHGALVDTAAIDRARVALAAWRTAHATRTQAEGDVEDAAQAVVVEEQALLMQTDALARLDGEHKEREASAVEMLGAALCERERVLTKPRDAARAMNPRVVALRAHADATKSTSLKVADAERALRPLEVAAGASAARHYELTVRLDAARIEEQRLLAARKALWDGEATSLMRARLVQRVDEARTTHGDVARALAQAEVRAQSAAARVVEITQQRERGARDVAEQERAFTELIASAGVYVNDVAKAAALDDDALDRARDAVRALDDACARAEAVLAERRALALTHAGTQPAVADLNVTVEEARAALAIAVEARGNARAALLRDDDVRDKAARLLPELDVQRERTRTWTALADVIGSSDGARFRVFAQSLTLDALLVRANEQLAMLAPRYRLERVPTENEKRARFDLELVVIDRESGDEPRGTASLSGGETFLVSLALALGLSSLSSSRTPVESLFIDEGFSSLDAETLEAALAALEALRATGRQIGVISHVPALVERIGAQVRVVPLGGGRSRVDVRAS